MPLASELDLEIGGKQSDMPRGCLEVTYEPSSHVHLSEIKSVFSRELKTKLAVVVVVSFLEDEHGPTKMPSCGAEGEQSNVLPVVQLLRVNDGPVSACMAFGSVGVAPGSILYCRNQSSTDHDQYFPEVSAQGEVVFPGFEGIGVVAMLSSGRVPEDVLSGMQ